MKNTSFLICAKSRSERGISKRNCESSCTSSLHCISMRTKKRSFSLDCVDVRMIASRRFHSSSGYACRHFSSPRVTTKVCRASGSMFLRIFDGMLTRPFASTVYVSLPLKDDIRRYEGAGMPPHFSPLPYKYNYKKGKVDHFCEEKSQNSEIRSFVKKNPDPRPTLRSRRYTGDRPDAWGQDRQGFHPYFWKTDSGRRC